MPDTALGITAFSTLGRPKANDAALVARTAPLDITFTAALPTCCDGVIQCSRLLDTTVADVCVDPNRQPMWS